MCDSDHDDMPPLEDASDLYITDKVEAEVSSVLDTESQYPFNSDAPGSAGAFIAPKDLDNNLPVPVLSSTEGSPYPFESDKNPEDETEQVTNEEDKQATDEEDKQATDEEDKQATDEEDKQATDEEDKQATDKNAEEDSDDETEEEESDDETEEEDTSLQGRIGLFVQRFLASIKYWFTVVWD